MPPGISGRDQSPALTIPTKFSSRSITPSTTGNRLPRSYYETSGHQSISPGGNLPWSTENFDWRQQNVNLSDTFTLSASMANQFWVGYTRNFGGRLNTPQTSLGDLGSSFNVQGPPALPQITVTGYFTLGASDCRTGCGY